MAWRRGFRVIRRSAPARIRVEFPAPGFAGVEVSFPGGGTGRPEAADRLDLVLGLLASGVHGTDEGAVREVADRMRTVATAIAGSPDGELPSGTVTVPTRREGIVDMRLVPWSGARGGAVVTLELVRSAVGPVPVARSSPSATSLVLAGLMAACAEAGATDADGRLALALAIEGLIAWYVDSHRLTPVRDAVESARTHAADRLRQAGRVPPDALAGAPA